MAAKKEPTDLALPPDLHPIVQRAQEFEITDDKSMATATEMLSELNRRNDAITAEKDKVMRPILDAAAAERGRWKPSETILAAGIAAIRKTISTYQTAKRASEQAEKDKIADRVGEGRGKFTLETAARKAEEIETAPAIVQTEAGSIKFRTTQTFEITDITQVPHEYLLPDEPKIRAAMKAGTKIAGVTYSTEEIPINSRR